MNEITRVIFEATAERLMPITFYKLRYPGNDE
jgi:hypothetical protein